MSDRGIVYNASGGGIAAVARAILAGELAVIPTDTVYGLAATATSEGARKLFAAKGRPENRAIPVLLSETEAVSQVVSEWPEAAQALASQFWPGALTIVVPASPGLPGEITAGSGTVGVRVPANAAARAVIAATGGYLAVTSANRSGQPTPTTALAALAALAPAVRVALDGGNLAGGVPSTVVAVEQSRLRVLRLGAISPADLLAALQRLLPARHITFQVND